MEDGSSQSFLGSLIKTLSSALSEHQDSENHAHSQETVRKNSTTQFNKVRTILDGAEGDLNWIENSIEDQDMVDSMNIHKRILDLEIDSIDKELDSILKNKETVDYLITLLKKRERLETQVHQLEDDIGTLQKEG